MMSAITGLFIALCWAIFLVFIVYAAFSAKRRVESDRRWTWSWLVLALIVAAVALVRVSKHLPVYVTAMVLPHTVGVCLGADLLALAGLFVASWGRVALGRNWNLFPSFQDHHELIQSGPYAYVRHPMYSGLTLMFLGAVIWNGAGYGFILFFCCSLGTWFKLRQEEKLLTRHFGAEYSSYRSRVKALIPFVI